MRTERKTDRMLIAWQHLLLYVALGCAVFLASCSLGPVAGSGTEEGNVVTGSIVDSSGNTVSLARVRLIPAQYNPVEDKPLPNYMIDTTDKNGTYRFVIPSKGVYNIEAMHSSRTTCLLITGIVVASDSVFLPAAVLQTAGALRVFLPDTVDTVKGYVYIQGTTIATSLSGNYSWVLIDSVPAGSIPSLYYKVYSDSYQTLIRYNAQVSSGDTVPITMPTWKYSKQLYLNTTASGAQISGNVLNFPVLVRLTRNNFNFTEAKNGGEDIRFTKADNTLLPYEIEYWNSAGGEAAIWVRIDTIYGNNNTQFIMLAWGNADAVNVSNSAFVFDTTNGFQGVWHLGNEGNSPAYDATGNHYDGIPKNMTASSAVPGMIGRALEFDGASSYISIPGTASGKLNFPAKGTYSLYAWVCTDSLRGPPYSVLRNSQEIISKGDLQYNLDIDKNDRWHMSEVEDVVGYRRIEAGAQAKQWTLVVGVRNGSSMDLYINGELRNDSLFTDGQGSMRDTTWNIVIGKMSDQNNRYFDGKIDEVRVANVALTPDWIRLCYMNQKPEDALIKFKQ